MSLILNSFRFHVVGPGEKGCFPLRPTSCLTWALPHQLPRWTEKDGDGWPRGSGSAAPHSGAGGDRKDRGRTQGHGLRWGCSWTPGGLSSSSHLAACRQLALHSGHLQLLLAGRGQEAGWSWGEGTVTLGRECILTSWDTGCLEEKNRASCQHQGGLGTEPLCPTQALLSTGSVQTERREAPWVTCSAARA